MSGTERASDANGRAAAGGGFEVPVRITERHALPRDGEAVTVGVPFPRGRLDDASRIGVQDDERRNVPAQARTLARWSDGSVKWLLVDLLATVPADSTRTYCVTTGGTTAPPGGGAPLAVFAEAGVSIRDGSVLVRPGGPGETLVTALRIGDTDVLRSPGLRLELIDARGREYSAVVDSLQVVENGPLKCSLAARGGFVSGARRAPIVFEAVTSYVSGSDTLRLEIDVWNPRAAAHPGNLWDLGDRGSFLFRALELAFEPAWPAQRLARFESLQTPVETGAADDWRVYQDSSGGRNWDSTNHRDAAGRPTVTFAGYRVSQGSGAHAVEPGGRASPGLAVCGRDAWIGLAPAKFWQNFPASLAWSGGRATAGLFPRECRAPFELQGGERKRQTVHLPFGTSRDPGAVRRCHAPLLAVVDPAWVAESGAVAWLTAPGSVADPDIESYVGNIVEGGHSFFEKREVVDEYGWRNFGDLYADHEAVGHTGDKPLVSHYNNQYDFLLAAAVHFLRAGDARWQALMLDAARHAIDIDIYHTTGDRAVYNGGMFWHTDHYLDAATATHRTYSRGNKRARSYGGGPSNEHNYTSGLLMYYFLSGDASAREAVTRLANWVVDMDDGSKSPFAFLSTAATGKASSTVSRDYHGPGRGAGNSINALLDAYTLSGRRDYMRKAEELLCRCIHPRDDVAALRLDEPEHRWSYLVFLQVLGKFLESKLELGETDYYFFYARDSLRRYASWMLDHEVPYKDVLDKVELPTETWPAQDIRKSHVFHLAAMCCAGEDRKAFAARAAYFHDRSIRDLLTFETAFVTRPLVLMAVYGHVHAYFLARGYPDETANPFASAHAYDFGEPQAFRPQHAMLAAGGRARLASLVSELARMLRDRLSGVTRALRERVSGRSDG